VHRNTETVTLRVFSFFAKRKKRKKERKKERSSKIKKERKKERKKGAFLKSI